MNGRVSVTKRGAKGVSQNHSRHVLQMLSIPPPTTSLRPWSPIMPRFRRMPRSYLEGKVVWITGASSGLGEQLALAAAAGGAEGVILSGRRVAELERVQRACEKARPDNFSSVGGVRLLPFDVGDLEFVEKEAAPRALKEFGRVDTLVLNAGVSARTPTFRRQLLDTFFIARSTLSFQTSRPPSPPPCSISQGKRGQWSYD